MKLPESADQELQEVPQTDEAYIRNPYPGKELLTQYEVIDAINLLSGMLLADKINRGDDNQRRTG